jgi:hypothetical protein
LREFLGNLNNKEFITLEVVPMHEEEILIYYSLNSKNMDISLAFVMLLNG